MIVAVLAGLVAFEAFIHYVVHPWQGEWSSHLGEHAVSGSILLVAALGLSILISRLFDRLHGRVAVLHEAAMVAVQDVSLNRVLERVVQLARHVCRAPYVSVRVGEEVAAAWGRLPAGGAEFLLPIAVRGERAGELVVGMPPGRRLALSDRTALETLAAQAGIALGDAQLYEEIEELTSLREIARVGMELHDEVVQRLFAVGLQLEAATELVRDDPSEAVARMGQADQAVHTMNHEIITYLGGLGEAAPASEGSHASSSPGS